MGRVVEHASFRRSCLVGWEQGGLSEEGAERPVQGAPARPLAAPDLPAGALSALVQGLGGRGGGSRGVLPSSSSAAALLGAQPIPSIATTSIPAFQESGLPSSHVLRACSQLPGTVPRAREGSRLSRTGAGSTMTVTKVCPAIRRTCSSTPIARTPPSASGRVRAAISLQRDGCIGSVPANTKTFGDAGQGGVVGDQRGQGPPLCPKSSYPPELVRSTRAKARLGHVGALL